MNAIDVLRHGIDAGRAQLPNADWSGEDAALAAVESLVEAAEPMANLPWPLSADERQEWIVNQNRLRDALRAVRSIDGEPAVPPAEQGERAGGQAT